MERNTNIDSVKRKIHRIYGEQPVGNVSYIGKRNGYNRYRFCTADGRNMIAEISDDSIISRIVCIVKNNKAIIALSIICILSFLMVLVVSGIKKIHNYSLYKSALNDYKCGIEDLDIEKLDSAKSVLEAIDYKDADEFIDKINKNKIMIEDYKVAQILYDEGELIEAMNSFGNLGEFRDAKDKYNSIAEELYQQGCLYIDNNDFDKAEMVLNSIPDSTSIYSDVVIKLEEAKNTKLDLQNQEMYKEAITYYTNGDYLTAQSRFISLEDYGDSKEYLEKIGEELYSNAKELYDQKSYIEALEVLDCIEDSKKWSGYSRAAQLKSEITDLYVENALAEADSKYSETHDIEESVEILTSANDSIGTDARLTAAINDYKNNTMIYISDLDMFNYSFSEGCDLDGGEAINEYLTSNYGVTYKNSVTCSGGYIGYLVSGKGYTIFKGVLGCPEGMHSDSYWHGAYIEVFGYKDDEGTLLYTSDEITDASKPIDIEVDITDYDVIYFQWNCIGCNIWKDWGEFATIFEGRFMK